MTAAGLGLQVAPIAQLILDGVVAHYAAAQGVDLPKRRVIAAGNPRLIAWEQCEQVVVTMSGIGIGSAPGENAGTKTGGQMLSSMGLRHAVYAVQITRHAVDSPDGATAPAEAAMTSAGLRIMRDAGLLSQALIEVCNTVAAELPRGATRVQPGAVEMIGPEGGFVAVEGSLAVTAGLLA